MKERDEHMLLVGTELEAINSMLSAIGEQPVNSTEDNVDAVMASRILNEMSRAVQSEGWYFNREKNYKVHPDLSGKIQIPAGVISYVSSAGHNSRHDLVQRGGLMYDLRNHTSDFDSPVVLDVIWLVDFLDLPTTAQQYITIKAARKFQTDVVGDNTLNSFIEKDEFAARVALLREEQRSNNHTFMQRGRQSMQGLNVPNRALWRTL
jgi:hypothetical protein